LFHRYKQIEIFSDLIALEKGIIHPTIALANVNDMPSSIDQALSCMSPEDSRKARRKFRKILRDAAPAKVLKRKTARQKRSIVMMHIRTKAWDLSMINSPVDGDNDDV